jgi:hypothetical protein
LHTHYQNPIIEAKYTDNQSNEQLCYFSNEKENSLISELNRCIEEYESIKKQEEQVQQENQ